MGLKARTVLRIPHSEQSVLDTVKHTFWTVIRVQRARGSGMVGWTCRFYRHCILHMLHRGLGNAVSIALCS